MKTLNTETKVDIRWMIRVDLPRVLEIEAKCFESPWQENDFTRTLRQTNCIGMVSEFEQSVVGFMVYELQSTSLHVLNFAVDPEYQRCNVGRQMVEKLVKKLSRQRRTRITLEVRETNLSAQLFFRAVGFRAVSILREFYDDEWDTNEDAYLMQYRQKA